jgi:glucose-6-phosphate 1-dehydrogenase
MPDELGHGPADVFVVFGITGDLAKVMTFPVAVPARAAGAAPVSHRRRGGRRLTKDQLVERARESIVGTGEQLDEDVFGRLAARLSYVPGDEIVALDGGRVDLLRLDDAR